MQKKKKIHVKITSFTWWQILLEDEWSLCSGISVVIRGFQCLNGQWTMWGWREEWIWLLAFFNGEPHHFNPPIQTSQKALPTETQRLQESHRNGLNQINTCLNCCQIFTKIPWSIPDPSAWQVRHGFVDHFSLHSGGEPLLPVFLDLHLACHLRSPCRSHEWTGNTPSSPPSHLPRPL